MPVKTIQTAQQVEQAFKAELQALLDKYVAELEAADHWQGYAECGKDVRMEVTIPAIYDVDGDCLREFTCINLGKCIFPNLPAQKEVL